MSCPWEGDGRCENPVFQKLDEAQAEVMRLTKERDEARAEVERLRGLIKRLLGHVVEPQPHHRGGLFNPMKPDEQPCDCAECTEYYKAVKEANRE